jgi:carboxyl-terminal processing protease
MLYLKKIGFVFAVLFISVTSLAAAPKEKNIMSQKDVEHFAIVMAQIQHYYVKPTDYKTLFENAIRGMLNGLDPHSSYLDMSSFRDLNSKTAGHYAGIGIQIIPENGLLKVISPFDGTPAAKANIESGDIILKINNYFIKDIGPEKAVNLLLGKAGSKVTITVFKTKKKRPKKITLIRKIIKIKSIKSRLVTNDIGYVRIAVFGTNTLNEIKTAIIQLKKAATPPLKGFILDVRNNPGGTLDAAIAVSDLFLDANKLGNNTTIVSTVGRTKSMNTISKATPGDLLKGTPIIVLINGGSASASEILASALAEHNRGITLGTKTFGKGSVQAVIPTTPTSAIKITTALYYTPRGHAIQAKGVIPDVIVPYRTLPKSEKTQSVSDFIDESQLYRHLKSKPKKSNAAQASKIKLDRHLNRELAHQDFQLYQAIKLLQGMLAMHN